MLLISQVRYRTYIHTQCSDSTNIVQGNICHKIKNRPKGSKENDGDNGHKDSKKEQKQTSSLLKYDGVSISFGICTRFKFMKI